MKAMEWEEHITNTDESELGFDHIFTSRSVSPINFALMLSKGHILPIEWQEKYAYFVQTILE